jgi:hypothetical protein
LATHGSFNYGGNTPGGVKTLKASHAILDQMRLLMFLEGA